MLKHGITFADSLIFGVMSGAIRVTSRVIKPQPPSYWSIPPARLIEGWLNRFGCSQDDESSIPCPFRAGERQYVREAWFPGLLHDSPPHYRVDSESKIISSNTTLVKWRSAVTMPGSIARTWIEITVVNAARCQDITEEEAIASGARGHHAIHWPDGDPGYMDDVHVRNYAALWDHLNAKNGYPWSLNAWVWRVTFRLSPDELPEVGAQ